MSKKILNTLIFLVTVCNGYSQIDSESLMGLPVVTTVQRTAIPSASINQGSVVYDSDELGIYQFNGATWEKLSADAKRIIVLNRVDNTNNNLLVNATNTYFDLPLNAAHIQINSGANFTVLGDGEIRVLTDGTYLISSELATNNMPSGGTKYILGCFINGALVGYLTRGFVTLPNSDWWGATGVLMYNLQANDVVNIRYVLNNGGTPLNARFLNIGITRL